MTEAELEPEMIIFKDVIALAEEIRNLFLAPAMSSTC